MDDPDNNNNNNSNNNNCNNNANQDSSGLPQDQTVPLQNDTPQVRPPRKFLPIMGLDLVDKYNARLAREEAAAKLKADGHAKKLSNDDNDDDMTDIPSGPSIFDHLVEESWNVALKDDIRMFKPQIDKFLIKERQTDKIFPPTEEIFNALNLTPLPQVKVVILGQDCYLFERQAHGLCFSVRNGIKIPPSLENIISEIKNDVGVCRDVKSGDLSCWAKNGVLLLNCILTVRRGKPLSHQSRWEKFTDKIIQAVSQQNPFVVFLLWGSFARNKKFLIDKSKHVILESSHPSPNSVDTPPKPFRGCKHFTKCNIELEKRGLEPIDWEINH